MIDVKIKLDKEQFPNIQMPKKATSGSAGYDLVAVEENLLYVRDSFNVVEYRFGLSIEIPEGYIGKIYNRSSCYKHGSFLSNCVGVIDSDYRGEIKAVVLQYAGSGYNVGDRIAQLIIEKLPDVQLVEVDELSETERGNGGFGSTGK